MNKPCVRPGLRVRAFHRYTYRPNGCEIATVTRVDWDIERQRAVVSLEYDNGTVDWLPLSEFDPSANNGEPAYVSA